MERGPLRNVVLAAVPVDYETDSYVNSRKLPVKNDDKIASSGHLYCSLVILFFARLSNPPTDIPEVIITENSNLKQEVLGRTNMPTFPT